MMFHTVSAYREKFYSGMSFFTVPNLIALFPSHSVYVVISYKTLFLSKVEHWLVLFRPCTSTSPRYTACHPTITA